MADSSLPIKFHLEIHSQSGCSVEYEEKYIKMGIEIPNLKTVKVRVKEITTLYINFVYLVCSQQD
jgi:hypothetical protein